MDVLHGAYIQGRVQQPTSIGSICNPMLLLESQSATFSKLLTIAALVLAMTGVGCARNWPDRHSDLAQHEAKADAVRAAPPTAPEQQRYTQSKPRRVARALPAPDCEFKSPEPKTVDADQWPRLQLDVSVTRMPRRRHEGA
jgi:hypothetical protein